MGYLNWPAIFRAVAIIVGITAIVAFAVPVVGAVIDGDGPLDTGNITGHEIYRVGVWVIAWVATIAAGAWMLRNVHTRIIDDMLVAAILAAMLLLIVRIVIGFVFEPRTNWEPDPAGNNTLIVFPTFIEVACAALMVVLGMVAARVNAYKQ